MLKVAAEVVVVATGVVVRFRSSRNTNSLHCHRRKLQSYHRQSTTNAAQLMHTYASVSCINSIFPLMPSFTKNKKQPHNNKFLVICLTRCVRDASFELPLKCGCLEHMVFRLQGLDLFFGSLIDGSACQKALGPG